MSRGLWGLRTAADDVYHQIDEWGNHAHDGHWDYADPDVDDHMNGECRNWALWHKRYNPHLRIGIEWSRQEPEERDHPDDEWVVSHAFTHDDHWAYDARGAFPLADWRKWKGWDDVTFNHEPSFIGGSEDWPRSHPTIPTEGMAARAGTRPPLPDTPEMVKDEDGWCRIASTDGIRYAHIVEADVAEDLVRLASAAQDEAEAAGKRLPPLPIRRQRHQDEYWMKKPWGESETLLRPHGKNVALYHRTTPEEADRLVGEGFRHESDPDTKDVYFSDLLDGSADGFGHAVVKVVLPHTAIEGRNTAPTQVRHRRLDDPDDTEWHESGPAENWYRVDSRHLKGVPVTRIAMAWDEWAPQIKGGCPVDRDAGVVHCSGRYTIPKAGAFLDYHHYDHLGRDHIAIGGIYTHPEDRNDGVAEALIRRLAEDHPGVPIKPGVMTRDGRGFHDRMLDKEPSARSVLAMAWDTWAPQIKGGCENGCDHDRMMMGEYSIEHPDGTGPQVGDLLPGIGGRSLLQFTHDTDQHGNPEMYVSGIHVDENHRRDGIAEALMRRMRRDHPDTPINPGFMTDMGEGLLDGLKKRTPDAKDALVPRHAAVNREMVDRLNGEFHDWYGANKDDLYFTERNNKGMGPLGHWPNIEEFLAERYPAAHRDLDMGMEAAQPLMDGQERGLYGDRAPDASAYETGQAAVDLHGYDPREVAASMLLLHNGANPSRGDMAQVDQDRLNDIARKRFDMQRAHDRRTHQAAKPRGGDCYQAAGRYILDNPTADVHLVHADVTGRGPMEGVRMGHAWVEDGDDVIDNANGGAVRLPRDVYHALGDVRNAVRYTPSEAMAMMAEHEHFGPWHGTGAAHNDDDDHHEAALRTAMGWRGDTPDGLEFRHVHNPNGVDYMGQDVLTAHTPDGREVGQLYWLPSGEITWISVVGDHTGRDIGRAMVDHAIANHNPDIHHSSELTPSGRRWMEQNPIPSRTAAFDPHDAQEQAARDVMHLHHYIQEGEHPDGTGTVLLHPRAHHPALTNHWAAEIVSPSPYGPRFGRRAEAATGNYIDALTGAVREARIDAHHQLENARNGLRVELQHAGHFNVPDLSEFSRLPRESDAMRLAAVNPRHDHGMEVPPPPRPGGSMEGKLRWLEGANARLAAYTINCQRACLALDGRHRGLNVEARPNYHNPRHDPGGTDQQWTDDEVADLWHDRDGNQPAWIDASDHFQLATPGTAHWDAMTDHIGSWGKGARALIAMTQADPTDPVNNHPFRHVIMARVGRDGKVRYVDPQIARADASDWRGRVMYGGHPLLFTAADRDHAASLTDDHRVKNIVRNRLYSPLRYLRIDDARLSPHAALHLVDRGTAGPAPITPAVPALPDLPDAPPPPSNPARDW